MAQRDTSTQNASPGQQSGEQSSSDNNDGDVQAQMLATMVQMQEEHNVQVHPDWRNQGFAYYRAIWVECAELLDHYGWKWWKHTQPDMDQSRLELVDIWHFGLSDLMLKGALDETVIAAFESAPRNLDFRAAVELMAESTLRTKGFVLEDFATALANLPMSYTELFEMYVGKNVLNRFRQDHGYKDGSYRKLWNGREDNEHLVEALAQLPVATENFPQRLYDELQQRYDTADS